MGRASGPSVLGNGPGGPFHTDDHVVEVQLHAGRSVICNESRNRRPEGRWSVGSDYVER